MLITGKTLSALKSFVKKNTFPDDKLSIVFYDGSGFLAATDSYQLVTIEANYEELGDKPFSLDADIFNRIKGADNIEITDTCCKIGKWVIEHDFKEGRYLSHDSLKNLTYREEETFEPGVYDPVYMENASKLAKTMGGFLKIVHAQNMIVFDIVYSSGVSTGTRVAYMKKNL